MVRRSKAVCDTPDEAACGPTPETAAKLESDVIDDLWRAGRLRLHHVKAADELRRMWHALGRGMFPAGGMGGASRASMAAYPSPIERLTDAEDRIWHQRYRPWCDRLGAGVAIVYAVVWDNRPLDGEDEVAALAFGLDVYADLAGMTTRRAV